SSIGFSLWSCRRVKYLVCPVPLSRTPGHRLNTFTSAPTAILGERLPCICTRVLKQVWFLSGVQAQVSGDFIDDFYTYRLQVANKSSRQGVITNGIDHSWNSPRASVDGGNAGIRKDFLLW